MYCALKVYSPMVSSPVWNWVTGVPAGAALSSADSGCAEADGALLLEAGALETLEALAAPEPPQAVRPRAAVARPMALRKSLR